MPSRPQRSEDPLTSSGGSSDVPWNPWVDFAALGTVVLAVALLNDRWVSEETRPPHWDMGWHLSNSLAYLDALHPRTFYRLWTNYLFYPPFRYWTTLPFYLIFGTTVRVAVDTNIIFIALLAFSIYGIGWELWNRWTGLLAAVFILASPFYVSQFKEYQLDAPLGAMVAFSFYLLIKTNDFSQKKTSRLFGLSFALGMLTKWVFFLCLAFPLAEAVIQTWNTDPNSRKQRFLNLRDAAVIASVLSLFLWYAHHPPKLIHDLWGYRSQGDPPAYAWYSISYYWNQLMPQLYLVPFCLFILGSLISLLWKEARIRNRALLLFIVGNYVLFTLLHKDPRYTMPMLVGVSLVAVFPFSLIKNAALKALLSLLLLTYCAHAFYFISFGHGALSFKGVPFMNAQGYLIGAPSHENWHQEELVQTIDGYPPEEREVASSGLTLMYFNDYGLSYYAKRYGVRTKGIDERPAFLLVREPVEPSLTKDYRVVQKAVLPDGSTVELWKR